jgi:hypothetical protein
MCEGGCGTDSGGGDGSSSVALLRGAQHQRFVDIERKASVSMDDRCICYLRLKVVGSASATFSLASS